MLRRLLGIQCDGGIQRRRVGSIRHDRRDQPIPLERPPEPGMPAQQQLQLGKAAPQPHPKRTLVHGSEATSGVVTGTGRAALGVAESKGSDRGEGRMPIRTIPLVVVAVAALVLAAPAAAKVIEEATVCGARGCTKATPGGDAHAMLEGGALSDAPAAAPFYRIRLGIGDGSGKVFERFTILYVPSAHKVRAMDGQWTDTTAAAERALNRVTRGQEPFPAKRLEDGAESSRRRRSAPRCRPRSSCRPKRSLGSGGGGVPAWLIALRGRRRPRPGGRRRGVDAHPPTSRRTGERQRRALEGAASIPAQVCCPLSSVGRALPW